MNTPQIEIQPVLTKSDSMGSQHIYRLANGYGLSVIQGPYTYGGPVGLWEAGLVRFYGAGADDRKLVEIEDTPITREWGDQVCGYLSDEELAALLVKVATLPSAARAIEGPETIHVTSERA